MRLRLNAGAFWPRDYVPDQPDADLYFDFTRSRFRLNGVSAREFTPGKIAGLSVSRAHTGFTNAYVYNTLTGLYEPRAAAVARIGPGTGLLVEESRSFLTPKSRRLDDTLVWTLSNLTTSAVTGVDGVAGSATRLTATGANATALGASNTLASAARRLAPFIRRVAGTGNVDLTLDGGSTWTTVALTSSWQRLPIGQTVANPRVGIRIVSSGDEIDVDFANGETGSFDTSPVETTSAGSTATRAADNISVGGGLSPGATGYWYAKVLRPEVLSGSSVARRMVGTDGAADTTPLAFRNSVAGSSAFNGTTPLNGSDTSAAAGAVIKATTTWGVGRRATTANGLTPVSDANSIGSWSDIWIGQDNGLNAATALNSYLQTLVYGTQELSNAELQAVTQ